MHIYRQSFLQLQNVISGKQRKVVQSATGILRDESRLRNMVGETCVGELVPPSCFNVLLFPCRSSWAALLWPSWEILPGLGEQKEASASPPRRASMNHQGLLPKRSNSLLHQCPMNPAAKEAFAVRWCHTAPQLSCLDICSRSSYGIIMADLCSFVFAISGSYHRLFWRW